MGHWNLKLAVSVLGGLALFAVLLVPALLVQYRRYGRPSPRRVLGLSAVCVYAVALGAYTFLPLPDRRDDCAAAAARQLVPFRFVRDIVREADGMGVLAALTSRAALQVALNVALFVPFGLLVRRFAGRSVVTTTALAGLVSVLIELTQGTATWGLYACPYRVADVDDVIANTTGALVGALVAPRLLSWLPRPGQLTAQRFEPRPVTPLRRWLGMVVDLGLFVVVAEVVALLGRVALVVLDVSVPTSEARVAATLPALIAGTVTFVVPAMRGSGASYGQRLVWLRPDWPRGPAHPTVGRRMLAASVGLTWALSFAVGAFVRTDDAGQVLAILFAVPGLISPFAVPFTRRSRGISLALAGADLVDSRTRPALMRPR